MRGVGGWKTEHMDIPMNNFHTCFHKLFVYSVQSISFMILFFILLPAFLCAVSIF